MCGDVEVSHKQTHRYGYTLCAHSTATQLHIKSLQHSFGSIRECGFTIGTSIVYVHTQEVSWQGVALGVALLRVQGRLR